MLTPMSLVDLIAILPFYLGLYVTIDLRFLRVLRLLHLFKLTRYSPALGALLDVGQKEFNARLRKTDRPHPAAGQHVTDMKQLPEIDRGYSPC